MTSTNIYILLADNDPDFLNICSEFMERAGYRVRKAASPAEARQILKNFQVHLAIIDLRLTNDDQKDKSGLNLVKDTTRSIPKLITTNFPTHQDVRDAMKVNHQGSSPVVDFVDKKAGLNHLLSIVKDVIIQHVRINWDLDIRWDEREHLSFPHLVALIESDFDSAHLLDRTGEIEDLFRKLFYDYDQITISRLFWRKERRVALDVCAYSQQKEEQFVVTCGRAQNVRNELKRYEDAAPKDYSAIGTSSAHTAETLHFAAIAWTIPSVTIEETNTFAEFYRQSTGKQMRSALEHLFRISLAPWCQGGRFVDEGNTLGAIYRKQYEIIAEASPSEAFGHKIQALCNAASAANLAKIMVDDGRLGFQFPNGELMSALDPLPYLYGDTPFPNTDAVCGTVLGNVDVYNVLVDADGETTWLTDFSQAGTYPIWQDAVSLETSARFHFMDAHDLFAVFEFEKQLLDICHLSDMIPSLDIRPEYKKVLTVIQTIRQQIAGVAGEELLPYYIGLLFCTVNDLMKYDPDVRQTRREIASLLHRLLLAGMLCRKI